MSEPLANSNRSTTNQMVRLCLLLALLLGGSLPLFAWYGYARHGQFGIMAALTAAGVCLFAGCLAIVITALFQSAGQGLNGLLLSMLIRTGIPLMAGITLSTQGGPLAQAGVFGMILLNYLIMLPVETISAVQIVKKTSPYVSSASMSSTPTGTPAGTSINTTTSTTSKAH